MTGHPSIVLGALLAAVPAAALRGDGDTSVTGIAYDSRAVRPGDLFVALPGVHVDGHRYIAPAVAAGAAAVLGQEEPPVGLTVPYARVPDSRAAMADVAAAFYGHPSDRLTMVGVTGTDGKTTTGFLLHALLQGTGRPAGLIGTVSYRIGEHEWQNDSRQTTPEAPDVQRLLAAMVDAGVRYAVLEATSHALVLERLRGCRFDAGILTNVTSDHLDFHGSVEAYRAAKARLFRGLGAGRATAPVAVLNRDDASYDYMCAASAARVLSYGLHAEADVRASEAEVTASGIRCRVVTPTGTAALRSPLTGRFNVSNLLAALAYGYSQGIDLREAAAVLGTVAGVPGRMRRIDAGQPYTVIVDYAHTPDSLAKVLDELRPLTAGRLIAVFGAAGERDRLKRPVMGRLAAERCDIVILTDEDPRLEDRRAIIEEIAAGARAAGAHVGTSLLLHPDRREAIATAACLARPGDTILLAGKGHEGCIIMGNERIPWDEEREARAAIAAAAGAHP